MATTNNSTSSSSVPVTNTTPSAKTSGVEAGDHSVLIGWMAVLALLEQNVIATYGLEDSESNLLTNIAQATETRNQEMYGPPGVDYNQWLSDPTKVPAQYANNLSYYAWYTTQLISGNAPGGDKYVPAEQDIYSNCQISGQNDTAPMTREADEWTSTLQGNASSTDSDYQNAQALMSIAQTAAQRA